MVEDIVVLIPGILGSALERKGKPIWDIGFGAFGHLISPLGPGVKSLEITPRDADEVRAPRLLSNDHMIPFFFKNLGYDGIGTFLVDKLRLVPGESYFEFPYDWRLDNRESARRLQLMAGGWLEARRMKHANAKLVLVGHSMGGLVARYFVEVLGGWVDTRLVFTLGTPHRGSVKALDYLANGMKLGPLPLRDLTRVTQSLPSVHQLLPIYPCVGGEGKPLERIEEFSKGTLGEMDLDAAKAGIRFHREIEAAVPGNRAKPGYTTQVIPIVGSYQPTYLSALISRSEVRPLRTYYGDGLLEGDGTVPRLSATPIELSNEHREMFVACPHASLQNYDPVRVHIRSVIDDKPIDRFKAMNEERISVDLQDAYSTAEPVRIKALCTNRVKATVRNTVTGARTECDVGPAAESPDWQALDAGKLPEGVYRLRVEAQLDAAPVEDVFSVLHT